MILHGISVCSGKAQGPVRVLTSVAHLARVQEGDVVVVDRATPLYAPALKKAVGLVVAEGGTLSHAAVLAREYDVPCVILKDATSFSLLHDGDRVKIDGDAGIIEII